MLKRENQRIALTKRLLQDGLLRLLEEKELERISVTELCREAGINRATFYNHYSSPQELLSDMEARIHADLEALIQNSITRNDLIAQTEAVCTYMKEHANLVITLSRCHADDELAEIFNNLERRYVAQNQKSNIISRLDKDSIHLVSTFLYTGSYNMIREWLVRDIQKSPREIAELVLSFISKEYL